MTERADQDAGERLLEAAEQVLLADGLAALSVRRVTAAAGANVAAVNYTFGGKEALLESLLRRLLEPVTAERMRRIDALAASGAVTVPDLVRAYVEPLLDLHARLGSDFGELLVRLPRAEDRFRRSGGSALEPGIDRLLDALGPLLPGLSRRALRLRLGMLIGTVIAFSVGVVRLEPVEAAEEREELLGFVTAGLAC